MIAAAHSSSAGPRVRRYRCTAVARSLADPAGRWDLGGTHTTTPRLAVRWLRDRALLIAHALDPLPGAPGPLPPQCLREVHGHGPNPGAVMRAWLRDEPLREDALARLRTGLPVQVSAADDTVRYVLTAEPAGDPARAPEWR